MENDSNCIFCKIIKKEIPSHILYEDRQCLVILDAFPAEKGQTLVIPKQHVPYFVTANETLYTHILLTAKKVSAALDKTFKPLRVCLVIEGFEVPHFHVKLYPVKELPWKLSSKTMEKNEVLAETVATIKKQIIL